MKGVQLKFTVVSTGLTDFTTTGEDGSYKLHIKDAQARSAIEQVKIEFSKKSGSVDHLFICNGRSTTFSALVVVCIGCFSALAFLHWWVFICIALPSQATQRRAVAVGLARTIRARRTGRRRKCARSLTWT